MTFNPQIPQAGDRPSNSQAQLLTNFGQLNTLFNADHVAYNDATVANRGLHRKVTFITSVADPAHAFPKTQLYTKTSSNAVVNDRYNDLYYYEQNTTGTTIISQLTGGGVSAAAWVNYDAITPAIRRQINIASIVKNGVGDYTVNFSRPMTAADYATVATCNITGIGGPVTISILNQTTTSFDVGVFKDAATRRDPAYLGIVVFGICK